MSAAFQFGTYPLLQHRPKAAGQAAEACAISDGRDIAAVGGMKIGIAVIPPQKR
ncbi:MAG: hypothetical protein LBT46_12695 [Planctomycetaceae bacterium]|nr:hypothetical protein [Planctomycetaceae bacterium]